MVILYLTAIIAANLSVAHFGPSASIINAFLFIGLDLTSRDQLHDRWRGKYLWPKMLALIACGSLLSFLLNRAAGPIAIASLVAFTGAALADTVTYWVLSDKKRIVRVNISNITSSAVDSFLFPILAFGFPILWLIIGGQFIAKVAGGFIWAIILRMR